MGGNYLEVRMNGGKKHVGRNEGDGEMEYHVDEGKGEKGDVNYERWIVGGLKEGEEDGKVRIYHEKVGLGLRVSNL